MDNFLFKLLGKRERRIHILTKWRMKCETLSELIIKFVDCILYSPIDVTMYPEYMRIFPTEGLEIYYSWLTCDELENVKTFYLKRRDYFKHCNFFKDKAFRLWGCTANFKIENRRELVRDFVNIVKMYEYELLYAVQQLLLNPKADRFVKELHEAIQGRYDIKNLLCIYS